MIWPNVKKDKNDAKLVLSKAVMTLQYYLQIMHKNTYFIQLWIIEIYIITHIVRMAMMMNHIYYDKILP